MLPVLLDLKVIKIYTFGVFLVLAFFWGAYILWRNFLLTAYKEEEVFDGLFLALVGGLFLSRFLYVTLNFQEFGFDFLKFILINGYPGLSLIGFIAGSILTLYFFSLAKKIPFFEVADYFIPSVFLSMAFGKLGSFFSGVEVGSKTTFFLSLRYPLVDGARHLTSLYEAVLFFAGAYLTQRILFATRRDIYPKGFAFSFFLWYFGVVNFLFDPLKENRSVFLGMKFDRMASLVLLLTFSFYFLYYFRNLIFGKMVEITGFFRKDHGKKTVKIGNRKVQRAPREGKGKDSSED